MVGMSGQWTKKAWRSCTDLLRMVYAIWPDLVRSERKLRLFLCALCRRIPEGRGDGLIWNAVAVAERFADGLATAEDLAAAHAATYDRLAANTGYPLWAYELRHANHAAYLATVDRMYGFANFAKGAADDAYKAIPKDLAKRVERAMQCEILRDIFSNAIWPADVDVACLRWKDSCVVKLAQGIYDERRFQDLPILADALTDAGCNNEEVLAHCRRSVPHVRGCWALDLLLGKK